MEEKKVQEEEVQKEKVHLLFAISWLEAAWVGVSSSTIKNCFSHSGFVMDEAMKKVVEEEMNRCFEALKKHQAIDVNYIDFLEVDKDVQVAGEQSIEEIVKEGSGVRVHLRLSLVGSGHPPWDMWLDHKEGVFKSILDLAWCGQVIHHRNRANLQKFGIPHLSIDYHVADAI
ncbi:hypothetical protein LAZ67_13000165 [Cordylochernes scorpioides]|uniref:Uncharacterized protein n=1 Tax=Cordylochernes scorpioides TaxID=51811 RepID=A0ABY6L5C4_9ARAC|nr:hypothetical protein LAZ67_13000165 [Cordylochernes scorpioides]